MQKNMRTTTNPKGKIMKKILTYALPLFLLFTKTGCGKDEPKPQGKRVEFTNIQVANPETVPTSEFPQFKTRIQGYSADPMVAYIQLISLTRFAGLPSVTINGFLDQIETLIAINPSLINGAETIYFTQDSDQNVINRARAMGFNVIVR